MLLQGDFKKIAPASGAIIMANGIFLIGAVEAFPFLNNLAGKWFAFILLITWIVIYKKLSVQFFYRDFLIPFIKHPVNSFAIGTWIAGVSVLCNVFIKYFPSILIVTQVIAIFNTFLFLFFLVNIFYNFKQLIFDYQDYPVHGILLISTVGTQSIIVLLNNVLFQLPSIFSELVIMLGLVFYTVGIILIIKRYRIEKGWTLIDDWENTNCIIHGALSITVLAIVSSNVFTSTFVTVLWLVIFILLFGVELIEMIRAILRIKCYGWNKGIFQYHVTQWSRNFTFGMFYTFTLYMHQNSFYHIPIRLEAFQHRFMSFWAWVVLFSLVGQIGIFIKSRLEKSTPIYEKQWVNMK